MNEKIKQYLKKIQEDKEIEVLLACETGSRAWGFPSPDSDYDVRFIYRHKKLFYALRCAVACKWIVEKETMPPIEFKIMLEELAIEEAIKHKIQTLIALKATKSESYLHKEEKALNYFIETLIVEA